MAKWLRRWLHKPKVVSSNQAVGKKNFSFCKSRFRSLQLEEAHSNEINHDLNLANTLFQIKVRKKKCGCRLQWYFTAHVSFNEHIVSLFHCLKNSTQKFLMPAVTLNQQRSQKTSHSLSPSPSSFLSTFCFH